MEGRKKWKVKAAKALFALKSTVEEDVLEHIKSSTTPKAAWDILAARHKKKSDTRLQLVENEFMSLK